MQLRWSMSHYEHLRWNALRRKQLDKSRLGRGLNAVLLRDYRCHFTPFVTLNTGVPLRSVTRCTPFEFRLNAKSICRRKLPFHTRRVSVDVCQYRAAFGFGNVFSTSRTPTLGRKQPRRCTHLTTHTQNFFFFLQYTTNVLK